MLALFERLAGLRRTTVLAHQRVILLERGQVKDILMPGEHRINLRKNFSEVHDLNKPDVATQFLQAIYADRPDLAARHFTEVRTGKDEMAVILRDGRIKGTMKPDLRAVYWTDAGPWEVERFALTDGAEIAPDVAKRIAQWGTFDSVTVIEVPDAHVGLLTIDGAYAKQLAAGTHRFWNAGRKVAVKLIDLRWRAHDVTGQEIMTKDRVTLRVNLAADFRISDPLKAVSTVKDFEEALHRALQLAFRKTLGGLTLDELLADKVAVDAEAAAQVRGELAAMGVEVGAIALKDVILPGEMREILNQVVAATKEAEANVIRRREETNATRSLLNTAKVMAENPVMLRLKELEALEKIAGKVERLTVHNGTGGLLNDLVKLRD